jgi:hypothetical protein
LLVVTILIFGAATYAMADTTSISGLGGASKAWSDTVTVTAAVNSVLTLTLTTPSAGQTVDFGTVDPGTAYGPETVTLIIQSNRPCAITKILTGAAAIGLSTSLPSSSNSAETAGHAFSDNYSLNIPWVANPGDYTAVIQYTAIQD